jgi:3-methylcrotonyl-CoA carboxylase beta subunit
MRELIAHLEAKKEKLREGGGADKIQKLKSKGKLSAWERIEYLLDKGRDYQEIGLFAGEGLYEESCPNGGVVVVLGYVSGRLCVIVSNDATVKAGAWFPITGKKNLRAQEIAMENNLPIIYLVDSAGVYLPMQDEIFPDKEHFGRIFRNNARMSALGIPQISAIMGACVAGGAYLPIMSDYAFIVQDSGSVFLAGPYLVKSSIGENVDAETLGGASTHSVISGVTDSRFPDEASCLDAIKDVMDKMGHFPKAGFNRKESAAPLLGAETISDYLPDDRSAPYDMKQILLALTDADTLEEYKPEYGKTLICATARIDGWSVGIIANQREMVKAARPGGAKELQMGGVIYSDSADKAARFIMNCNQQRIPLVFLQDVSGFMVGSRSEQGGIIKDGAKMVNAMANSVVPKFTFIIGNSYGAGNYAMCGKAYDPRLIYAWPSAQMAVMSGASAGKTLLQIKEAALKSKGFTLAEEDKAKLLQEIEERYKEQLSPYYAAARLWVDGIVRPDETRKIISLGIAAADHAPITERYNVGVIQT